MRRRCEEESALFDYAQGLRSYSGIADKLPRLLAVLTFQIIHSNKKLCIHVTTVIDREHTFMPADTILAEAQSILSSVGTCSYTFGTCVDQSRLAGPLPSMREDVRIDLVEGAQPARLFKGLIGAYHYLGYRQANGAQVKYLVAYRDRPVACLSFGPAAFKVAARDQFIGWSAAPELELTWIGKANHPNLEQRILLDDPEKSHHAPHRVGENNIFDMISPPILTAPGNI